MWDRRLDKPGPESIIPGMNAHKTALYSVLRWRVNPLIALVVVGAATACTGSEADPSESAALDDAGRTMRAAFASDRAGDLDLYLLTPGADDVDALVVAPGSQYGPSWRPDGAALVYDSEVDDNTEVWRVAVDGTDPVQLTDRPGYDGGASYSPDGAQIVFVSDRDALVDGHSGRDLWLMNADGSDPIRLSTNEHYEGAPRFSPSGDRIAFCRQIRLEDGTQDGEIFVMDADGSNERRVTHTPGFDCLPDWSPDGTLLAFHRCVDGRCWIYALAPDGEAEAVRVSPDSLPGQWPRWAPNGGWIAYTTTKDEQTDIWAVRPDGSQAHALTTHPARDEVLAWQPR